MPRKTKAYGMRKRKGVARRRVYRRKNVVRRLNSSNQGYINVNRRLAFIAVQASAEAGQATVIDPSTSCLVLGTPTAVPGAVAGLYDIPFSMKFRLDQLTQYTEFQALFDNYKINAVKVFLKCFPNNSTATGVGMPWLEHWNDHDDSVPTTAIAARQHMGVKHKYFSGDKVVAAMYCKPRILDQVYANALSVGEPAALTRSTWLNLANPSVEHFAIKGILHNVWLNSGAGTNQFQFDVVVNASFKDVQ